MDDINSADSYVCFNCWHQINSFHQFYVKIKNIHSQLPTERSAVNNEEIEHNSAHNFYENHEEVVELEIDYLTTDTFDADDDENHVDSLPELFTSDSESMAEQKVNCVDSEQSQKSPSPKQQVKIMKLQTIEQIV